MFFIESLRKLKARPRDRALSFNDLSGGSGRQRCRQNKQEDGDRHAGYRDQTGDPGPCLQIRLRRLGEFHFFFHRKLPDMTVSPDLRDILNEFETAAST